MLSGGQMRRIELCRLLVMKPDLVIIFDEPATGLRYSNRTHDSERSVSTF